MEYGRCLLSKIFCIAFVFLAFCFVHYFSLDALNQIVGTLLPVLHVYAFAFERVFFLSLPVNVYTVSYFSIPIQIMYLAFLLVFCFSLRTLCRSILKSSFHPIPAHCFPLSHSLQIGSVYDHDTFKLSTYVTYSCYDGMGWDEEIDVIPHSYATYIHITCTWTA